MMLSVSAEPEAILNAINRGAVSCYLVKPCEAGALRDGVRNAFRSKLNRPGFLGGHVM
jgi:PleD family two-component response regulator